MNEITANKNINCLWKEKKTPDAAAVSCYLDADCSTISGSLIADCCLHILILTLGHVVRESYYVTGCNMLSGQLVNDC